MGDKDKSIKQMIEDLLESYRKDFQDKVGVQLIAVPAVDIRPVTLKKLKELTEKYFEVPDISVMAGRRKDQIVPRKFYIQAAYNMGYSMGEVAKAIDMDRTTAYQHIDKLNDKREMDKLRAGYMQFLYSQV